MDGNLAALSSYQKEQDNYAHQDARLERAKQELSNDMFDAYFEKNYAVIDEVEDRITSDTDTVDNLLRKLRDNFATDQAQLQYREFIAKACDELAYGCDSLESVERDRRVYGL